MEKFTGQGKHTIKVGRLSYTQLVERLKSKSSQLICTHNKQLRDTQNNQVQNVISKTLIMKGGQYRVSKMHLNQEIRKFSTYIQTPMQKPHGTHKPKNLSQTCTQKGKKNLNPTLKIVIKSQKKRRKEKGCMLFFSFSPLLNIRWATRQNLIAVLNHKVQAMY